MISEANGRTPRKNKASPQTTCTTLCTIQERHPVRQSARTPVHGKISTPPSPRFFPGNLSLVPLCCEHPSGGKDESTTGKRSGDGRKNLWRNCRGVWHESISEVHRWSMLVSQPEVQIVLERQPSIDEIWRNLLFRYSFSDRSIATTCLASMRPAQTPVTCW